MAAYMHETEIMQKRKDRIVLIYGILYFCLGLYFATSGGGYYTYDSTQKLMDLVQGKVWLILSILMAVLIYHISGTTRFKLWSWVINLSLYFVVLYALLYKGTDFGLNGMWGDNSNRLALVNKYREFSSIFQDWYYKGLPPFYPPLWFFLSGKLAWIFGTDAYKTIKFGYFVIYAFYPAALYFVWSKIAPRKVAFLVMFLTIFLRDVYLDYVYYEHITAALFIPWWLYYVEDIKKRPDKKLRWYILGGILGGLLFMTYYFWFFVGVVATILRFAVRRFAGERPFLKTTGFNHKLILGGLVLLFSSFYWVPLLVSLIKFGAHSVQGNWFHSGHLDIRVPFFEFTLAGMIYLSGLLYLGARSRNRTGVNLAFILLSIPALILVDRIICLFGTSLQTRKLIEIMPVFLAVPSAHGLFLFYRVLSRGHQYWRVALIILSAVSLLYWGNSHSQVLGDKKYQVGVNCRVPVKDLAVIETVDYRGKLFLTNHYIEEIFLPFYAFLSHTESTAHPASRYNERIDFLRYTGRLQDKGQAAFLLRENRFEPVDYFYLPYDKGKNAYYYEVYPLYFPYVETKLRLEFAAGSIHDSEYFTKKHDAGLFQIIRPPESVVELFIKDFDSTNIHSLVKEYNRLNLATRYLKKEYADSIRSYCDSVKALAAGSASMESIFEMANEVDLTDFGIIADSVPGRHKMRFMFKGGRRFREDHKIYVHAYPSNEESTEHDESGLFTNLDFTPNPPTTAWINNEYILLEKEINLPAGRYIFHFGFMPTPQEKGSRSYRSPSIQVE